MDDRDHKLSADREHPLVLILLFILIAYFPIFLKLDVLPLRIWDESRTAINAYEMYTTGNLLVAHYEGNPDMWGVKPPLLLWAQTLMFHVIGPGELAVRLPPAIAAFLFGWILFRFCWKRLGRPWLGILACAVMYSSYGIINMHGARSGDHDMPMILFMTWSLWKIYEWCEFGRRKDLLFFFILLAFGAITKSVQALLFLPGVAAYILARRKLIALLKDRGMYAGLVIFVLVVGAYYIGREVANPGYLEAVWFNEIGGRYAEVREEHSGPWDLYIVQLIERDMKNWYLLVPVGIALGLMQADLRLRHWTLLLTFCFLGYLLVVSTASTKLDWYVSPMIPLLAGLVAIALYLLMTALLNSPSLSRVFTSTQALPFLLLFLLFAEPWYVLVKRNYKSVEWPWDQQVYALSHLLKDASRGLSTIDADVIVHDAHYAHLLFYVRLLNDQGHDLRIMTMHDLRPGHRVLTDQFHVQEQIEQSYPHELVWEQEHIKTYRILHR